jgi:hypothetical protein
MAPVFYREGTDGIVRAGVIDAVPSGAAASPEPAAAFWYLTAGIGVVLLGVLCWWAERRIGGLPAVVGWLLTAFTVWGVVLMPMSGFWLFGIVAILAFRTARRSGAPARRR